ncbi:MAG TPA: methionyl-tRNA formyltransferase, partial [Candidatus Tectomicrobia bacterium]
MRIVVDGQQAFGKSVLEALLERGENVIAVYCAPDPKQGGRPDPLKEAALAHHLPVYQPRSFRNKPEVWEEFAQLKADLCVMAYVTLFIPEDMLNLPTHGTIQYHPSLLPRHRGPSSINWPIIWGETQTGLSIFWPDKGLDTGPILLQKAVEIRDTDTLGSLYFDRLYPLGVTAMQEAVDLVRAGQAPRIVQDETQATYEGWCKAENVQIDWHKPLQEIWNLVRGADPQPGAWTIHNGASIQLYDA